MNQEEKNAIIFNKLKENIGKEVTCVSYSDGVRKEVRGILKEVCDKYYISLGNEKHITDILPFIEVNNIILAILSDQEIIYLNNEVKGEARIFSREDIKKLRESYFGKEKEEEKTPLTLQEQTILYAFCKATFPSSKLTINGFEGSRISLAKESDGWKLYLHDEKKKLLNEFDNLHDACIYAIFVMSDKEVVQKQMLYCFCRTLLEASNKIETEITLTKPRKY